jgi:CBS domain-containing protein
MPTSVPVRTVMTTDVLTLRPDQSVREAAGLLLDHDVDGAPVLDDAGRVVGMLSTGDLVLQETEIPPMPAIALLGVVIPLRSAAHFEAELHKVLGSTVREVMHAPPVTTGPDATIGEAAAAMTKGHLSRLPVVGADGALLGIVSRADVVRVLLADLAGS